MAHSIFLSLLFISGVLLIPLFAARDIPRTTTASKNVDKKQPEWFIEHDPSVLIPGVGRVLIPDKAHLKHGFNPYTYNPITGTDQGNGLGIPSLPGGTASNGVPAYIPGNDDTIFPNPGFEVPTGAFPTTPGRH